MVVQMRLAAMATVIAISAFVPCLAKADVTHAYEIVGDPAAASVMVFFDTDKKISLFGRRDALSISTGDVEMMEPCAYGEYCVRVFGEEVPVVVPREGENPIIPGMTVTTEPYEFACCGPCVKTVIVSVKGERAENIHCSVIGIVSLKIHSQWTTVDLFLKSLYGLGAKER